MAKHYEQQKGEILFDYTTTNAIQVLSTDTPTHHSTYNTRTYLDLFLNKNIRDLHDSIVISELSSDHNPVLLNWPTTSEPEPGPTTWMLKNAD